MRTQTNVTLIAFSVVLLNLVLAIQVFNKSHEVSQLDLAQMEFELSGSIVMAQETKE